MDNFLTLMVGSSAGITFMNWLVLMVSVSLFVWVLFNFLLPPQLQILWTGKTSITWIVKAKYSDHSDHKRAITLNIPNKLMVLTYLSICTLAIIFFP